MLWCCSHQKGTPGIGKLFLCVKSSISFGWELKMNCIKDLIHLQFSVQCNFVIDILESVATSVDVHWFGEDKFLVSTFWCRIFYLYNIIYIPELVRWEVVCSCVVNKRISKLSARLVQLVKIFWQLIIQNDHISMKNNNFIIS